jgi:hypothetical protein
MITAVRHEKAAKPPLWQRSASVTHYNTAKKEYLGRHSTSWALVAPFSLTIWQIPAFLLKTDDLRLLPIRTSHLRTPEICC